MMAVSVVFGKICKICSTGWYVYPSVLHGLYCLSETLVARVLKVTVIPDCKRSSELGSLVRRVPNE